MLFAQIREEFNLDFSIKHFNHGAFGAIPNTVREFQRQLFAEIDTNPTGFYRRKLEDRLEEARLVVARYLNADERGFAWVRNASEGLSVAIDAVPLKTGDEVIATNQIYPSVRHQLNRFERQKGIVCKNVLIDAGDSDDDVIRKFEEAMTSKTKLICVDEISSPTGQIMPIKRIAEVARKAGVPIVVDAAHAPGMYRVNVDELQVDFWAGNFHKWLCAPHSAGCIWVAEKWRSVIRPSYYSFRDSEPFPSVFSRLGTDDQTAVLCVPEAIALLDAWGADKGFEHNLSLAKAGARAISEAIGTKFVDGNFGARRPVALPYWDETWSPRELQRKTAEELRTELSVTPPLVASGPAYITLSAFVYNELREYEEFGRDVASLFAVACAN